MRADKVTLTHGAIFRAARVTGRTAALGCWRGGAALRCRPVPETIDTAKVKGQTPVLIVFLTPYAKPARVGCFENSTVNLPVLLQGNFSPSRMKGPV